MLRDRFAVNFVVGIVGGNGYRTRVRPALHRELGGTILAASRLHLNEEGLVLFEGVPGIGVALELWLCGVGSVLIPDKVVVGLAEVGGEVAAFLHDLREELHAFGE